MLDHEVRGLLVNRIGITVEYSALGMHACVHTHRLCGSAYVSVSAPTMLFAKFLKATRRCTDGQYL